MNQSAAAELGTIRRPEGRFSPVADGVGRLCTIFVNLYVVDLPNGKWAMVDTGLPGFHGFVRHAVESRYGAGARPEAIVLTHGHFDHAGNARVLADAWDVPIIAHTLELPFLTGQSDYPPQDPTPGGAISFLSRFFPTHGIDLRPRIRGVAEDPSIAELPGWRWHHTPGHTSGHMSLMRDSDGVMLAGDAVVTTDLDAWSAQLTWSRELSRPPTPLTPDWLAARQSIRRLADLSPRVLATGHGLPMDRSDLNSALRDFAARMSEPAGGRYTSEPAQYAPDGSVAKIPPPVRDSLPWQLAVGGVGAILTLGILRSLRTKSLRNKKGTP